MKKPGFIFLFSTSTLTGQGAQSYALAVELMRRGHDVAIATDTRRGEGDFEAIARRDGVERLTSMALCTKAGPFSFVADVSRLKRIVRDRRPDYVVTSYSNDNAVAAMACPPGQGPAVLRFFHSRVRTDPMSRWVLGRTKAILFFAGLYLNLFNERLPGLAGRSRLLAGPVDLGIFHADAGRGERLRAEFGVTPGMVVCGMVARFQAGRRHDVLIRAFASIAGRHPELRLMLVGWGETQDAMRALAAGLGVEDRVIFTGFRVDGFQDVYRGMDFFVQLAEGHDTSCRSVVEAMASGLPVILARRGIMGELIDDGVEGLLAGADCGPDELASLVERLSADAGTRHAMGVAASARVASNSLPAVTDRFLEIIA